MTALQFRIATGMALDKSLDLSKEFLEGGLFGFGLEDFPETHVSLRVVAATIRWQCQRFDGTWDWKQYNEDRPHYLRKEVQITDFGDAELKKWLLEMVAQRMAPEPEAEAA